MGSTMPFDDVLWQKVWYNLISSISKELEDILRVYINIPNLIVWGQKSGVQLNQYDMFYE